MKKILWFTLPLLLAVAGGSGVMAQTNVSGIVASNSQWTVANGPYTVTGDVTVALGVTLSLEPGLIIRFDPNTSLLVDGTLLAVGNATDSIFFTANTMSPDTGDWRGIRVSGSAGGFMSLDYCRVQDAADAVSIAGLPTARHVVLRNTLLRNNARAVSGLSGNQEIGRCSFDENQTAVFSSSISLRRCSFNANAIAISVSSCEVDSCTFGHHTAAALANSSGSVRNSLFLYNKIGLLNHGGSTADSVKTCQFAENDTAVVTAVSLPSFLENELCNNIVNVRVSSSSNVMIGSNCWCTSDTTAIQASLVDGRGSPGLGVLDYSAVNSTCGVIGQVWPGDTDYDGVARVRDLLHIGVAYGFTGSPRNGASATWMGQAGLPWDWSFANGINYKHADCDGNGVVDFNDTLAILSNYGQTHYKTQRPQHHGGVPLYIEIPRSAGPGDTIELNIRLGDAGQIATDVYGIAFSLQLDGRLIDVNSPVASLSGTWIGQPGQNLIDLSVKDGDFHWAIVRNDHRDTTGHGRLGGVTMVMIDDLTGETPLADALQGLDISLITNKGEDIPADLIIVPVEPCAPGSLVVCPNPANARLVIMLDTINAEEVAIYSQNGMRSFLRQGPVTGNVEVQTSHYGPGIYFLRVRTAKGMLTKKILITR